MTRGGLPLMPLLALSACSGDAPPPQKAEGAEHIACAVGGAADFREVCAVERARRGNVLTLVIRHPDGAFRRFDVLNDGRGLAVADGATQAITRFDDGRIEVAVDKDRYRFPVTVRTGKTEAGDAAQH